MVAPGVVELVLFCGRELQLGHHADFLDDVVLGLLFLTLQVNASLTAVSLSKPHITR